jgi:site-specific DNA-methyltransferase (adenine-specific)
VTVRLLLGDMREQLAELADSSIDSIVTDPPYHLTTGKKGGSGPASLNENTPAGRARIGTGFMGMKWDGGDVAMRPETWALLLRVAKPGAHLLAFSSSRTSHRMWCAVEDAGWEIRDTVLWLHGEGFPKSSNQRGAWEGWGTALKPAFEPIVLARKPLIGTVAENLEAYGVGALNISACRVPGDKGAGNWKGSNATVSEERMFMASQDRAAHIGEAVEVEDGKVGRWPANVTHDGSDEVVGMFPAEAGAFAPVHRRGADKFSGTYGAFKGDVDEQASTFHGDRGSAARFFWCPKASRRDRNDGLSGMPAEDVNWSSGDQSPGTFQSPNTDRKNENFHPTVKPTALMQYLCRLVTPRGGVVLDPFMGSGSTGKAAMREGMSFVGIELDERYVEIARRRIHSDAPLFSEVAA